MTRLPHSYLSVRRLIFGALTLVTVIPLLIFWFWPFSRAIDEDLNYVARAHLLIARNLGVALDRYYTDVNTVFNLLSANIAAGDAILDVEPLLVEMHFRHVCLVEPDSGRVVASFIHDMLTCPDVVPVERLSMFRTMAEGGETALSGVMAGPDGSPLIYIVRQTGDLLAVGALQTTYFTELAAQISFGERGHAAIVDQFGHVLAHPNAAWVRETRDLSGLNVVQHMLAGESGATTFYSPAMQADMIAGYTAGAVSGWGVMVPQPIAELESEVGALRSTGLSVLALGMVVALLVSWVLSGLLAKPIRQLLAITRSIDTAQPSARLAPLAWYAPSEMRALATSFNSMLARIGDAAEKVIQAQQRAEHANRAKTEFLANMSHELRTPLNAIVGFSDALGHGVFGQISAERQQEYIGHIHASALHLRDLIADVMDVSSIENGAIEAHEGQFALDRAIDDAINLVRTDALAKGIRVMAEHPDCRVTLYGDQRQFAQVLINLLNNAVKFTRGPAGRITVTTALDPAAGLSIAIADNGIGIPSGQVGAMLQPFKRGESSYVRSQPGSGLGLSIVSKILDLHGASLKIDSAEGVGTTVTIRWPLDRVLTLPAATPARPSEADRAVAAGDEPRQPAAAAAGNLRLVHAQRG
ncbi:MAG: ATP-binding protein [Alphaproteobacteria bacterium]